MGRKKKYSFLISLVGLFTVFCAFSSTCYATGLSNNEFRQLMKDNKINISDSTEIPSAINTLLGYDPIIFTSYDKKAVYIYGTQDGNTLKNIPKIGIYWATSDGSSNFPLGYYIGIPRKSTSYPTYTKYYANYYGNQYWGCRLSRAIFYPETQTFETPTLGGSYEQPRNLVLFVNTMGKTRGA